VIPIQIKKLAQAAIIPEYKTAGAAGMDLCALLAEPLMLHPGEQHMIPTGLAMYIGDPAYCGKIYPRSGLGAKYGLILGNTTGIIDSDYQGEIMICLWNRSYRTYEIQPGERIAQMVLMAVEHAQFEVVDEFAATERGAGGFGSTGVR
jgi:dUTP pyrophosphatase